MIEIHPLPAIDATVTVPGSKSLTQRALIAAALARGESRLVGPLASEDTEYSSQALIQMGVGIKKETDVWTITGNGGVIQATDRPIFLGNNGTATRFLTSVAALGHSVFTIDGDERMHERPIGPLLTALRGWGVDIHSLAGTDCPPLRITSRGIAGGHTILPEGKSSQYLSSLLLAAPCAATAVEIEVAGPIVSAPYVDLTLEVMERFGVEVRREGRRRHQPPWGCSGGRA